MDEDAGLSAVLKSFDTLAEVDTPPSTDFLSQVSVDRFRTPKDRIVDWALGGGLAMALILSAAVLLGVSSADAPACLLGVPLTLLFLSPFLGREPLQRPVRLTCLTLLGVFLALLGASIIKWLVLSIDAGVDIIVLARILQGTLAEGTAPPALAGLGVLLWGGFRASKSLLKNNPWVERRQERKRWRLAASLVVVGFTALLLLNTASAASGNQDASWVIAAKADPDLERFSAGRKLSRPMQSLLTSPGLEKLGLPTSWPLRVQFVNESDRARLGRLAQELTQLFSEREPHVTDFGFALSVLKRAEDGDRSSLALIPLWELLRARSRHFGLVGNLSQRSLNGHIADTVLAPPIARAQLSLEELESLDARVRDNWTLTKSEHQRLFDVALVDTLLLDDLTTRTGHWEPLCPLLPGDEQPFQVFGIRLSRSLPRLVVDLERSYFLARYENRREGAQPDLEWSKRWGTAPTLSLLNNPGTYWRLHRLVVRTEERVEPSRGHSLLLAVLEAKLHKAKTGEFPLKLTTASRLTYESDGKTARFYTEWAGPHSPAYEGLRLR